MIILTVRMHAFPEKQKEVMQTLLSMIEPTGKEKGCLSHDVFCDIEDKNAFTMLEAWENREYLEHHLRSNRFGVAVSNIQCFAWNKEPFSQTFGNENPYGFPFRRGGGGQCPSGQGDL